MTYQNQNTQTNNNLNSEAHQRAGGEKFMEKGDTAFNGHIFSAVEAESYNNYTREIERFEVLGNDTSGLKNRRALFFKTVIGGQLNENHNLLFSNEEPKQANLTVITELLNDKAICSAIYALDAVVEAINADDARYRCAHIGSPERLAGLWAFRAAEQSHFGVENENLRLNVDFLSISADFDFEKALFYATVYRAKHL